MFVYNTLCFQLRPWTQASESDAFPVKSDIHITRNFILKLHNMKNNSLHIVESEGPSAKYICPYYIVCSVGFILSILNK